MKTRRGFGVHWLLNAVVIGDLVLFGVCRLAGPVACPTTDDCRTRAAADHIAEISGAPRRGGPPRTCATCGFDTPDRPTGQRGLSRPVSLSDAESVRVFTTPNAGASQGFSSAPTDIPTPRPGWPRHLAPRGPPAA